MSSARDGVDVLVGHMGRSRVDMKASPFCRMCRNAVTLLAVMNALAATGQEAPLIREITSREVTMHVGGVQDPEIRSRASREVSLYVENGPDGPFPRWVSREVSLVRSDDRSPSALTNLVAVASPAGDRMQLNWRSYDQWAEQDVARFDVYWSSSPFTNVTSLVPRLTVPAESAAAVLTGLPAK